MVTRSKRNQYTTTPLTIDTTPFTSQIAAAPTWEQLYQAALSEPVIAEDPVRYKRVIGSILDGSKGPVSIGLDNAFLAIDRLPGSENMTDEEYLQALNDIQSKYHKKYGDTTMSQVSLDALDTSVRRNEANRQKQIAFNKKRKEVLDYLFPTTTIQNPWNMNGPGLTRRVSGATREIQPWMKQYLTPEEMASYKFVSDDLTITPEEEAYVKEKNKRAAQNQYQFDYANKAALGLYDVYDENTGQHWYNDVAAIRDSERAGRSGTLTNEEAQIAATQLPTTYADALKVGQKNSEIMADNMARKAEYERAVRDAQTSELTDHMRETTNRAAQAGFHTVMNAAAAPANLIYGVGLHNLLNPEDKRNFGWYVDSQAGYHGGPKYLTDEVDLWGNDTTAGKIMNFATDVVTDPFTWMTGVASKALDGGLSFTAKAGSNLINGSAIATQAEKEATKVLPKLTGAAGQAAEEAAAESSAKMARMAARARELSKMGKLAEAKQMRQQMARLAEKEAKAAQRASTASANGMQGYAGPKTVNKAVPTNKGAMGEKGFTRQTPSPKLNNALGGANAAAEIPAELEYVTTNPRTWEVPLGVPSWHTSGIIEGQHNPKEYSFEYKPLEQWNPEIQHVISKKKGNPTPQVRFAPQYDPTRIYGQKYYRAIDNQTNNPGSYDAGSTYAYMVNNSSVKPASTPTPKQGQEIVTNPQGVGFIPTYDLGYVQASSYNPRRKVKTSSRKLGGKLNYKNLL